MSQAELCSPLTIMEQCIICPALHFMQCVCDVMVAVTWALETNTAVKSCVGCVTAALGYSMMGFPIMYVRTCPCALATYGCATRRPGRRACTCGAWSRRRRRAQRFDGGDIVLSFEGTDIANDGTVPFRSGERISFSYLVSRKFVGDQARPQGLVSHRKQITDQLCQGCRSNGPR